MRYHNNTVSLLFIYWQVLNIERGATLVASDDFALWQTIAALPSYPSGREMAGPRYEPFIGGDSVWNFSITGGGEIDGQGHKWWAAHKDKVRIFLSDRMLGSCNGQGLNYTRGHLFELRRCGNLLLTNVTFRNSPFWTLHPWACAGVTVTHCNIHAPLGSPNTGVNLLPSHLRGCFAAVELHVIIILKCRRI